MTFNRFLVEDGNDLVADDRVFKNNKVVFNKVLGMAYSVDEIVEVLNRQGTYQDRVYDFMQNKIWYAQGMYRRTGDEKYKTLEETLRELRDELFEPKASSEKYEVFLQKWFKELKKEDSDAL